jgi:hypothetical protein
VNQEQTMNKTTKKILSWVWGWGFTAIVVFVLYKTTWWRQLDELHQHLALFGVALILALLGAAWWFAFGREQTRAENADREPGADE